MVPYIESDSPPSKPPKHVLMEETIAKENVKAEKLVGKNRDEGKEEEEIKMYQ